jgi:ribosomal protein S18 acetylase RimI-like enzyme
MSDTIASPSTPTSLPEGYRLEIVPDFSSVTPRAQEMTELFAREMDLPADDPDFLAMEIERMEGATFATIIDENERVVAMAGLEASPASDTEGIVVNVATSSEHRGEGLGRTVMDEITRRAISQGYTDLSLAPTDTAEAFYEKLGFVPSSTKPWELTKKL